jgi:hypothetical protein
LFALVVMVSAQGCATRDWRHTARSWAERGVGTVVAFGLHESCHLALGAALGADISSEMHWNGPHLLFGNLSDSEHRAVAVAGNTCTALAAEVVVDTGLHRKSDIAWGMAAFHSVNAMGYAFAGHGDSQHWRDFGGSGAAWQAMHATHATRIGAHLAWDAGLGTRVMRWWRGPGKPELPLPGDPGDSLPAPEWQWPNDPWTGFDETAQPSHTALLTTAPLLPALPRTPERMSETATLAPATTRPPWAIDEVPRPLVAESEIRTAQRTR